MTQSAIDEGHIREAAYFLWLEEGKPHGRDEEHWQKAVGALKPAKIPAKHAPRKPKEEVKATSKAKTKTAPTTGAATRKRTTAASAEKKPRTKAAKPAVS